MITNYNENSNYQFIDEARYSLALCGLISITSLVVILISNDSLLSSIDSIIDYNTGIIWAIVDTFGFISDLIQAISIILGSDIIQPSLLSCCFISLVYIVTYIVSNSEHFDSSVT